ncbi:TCFL5 protein, partial [Trogon melanurus]|nr:TCFL5 protein [Trogon melanurus]
STAGAPQPAPAGPGAPSDVSFGEQNLSFTTTDVSLVEMMEIEYTQLQHILYSHTEAQASEGEVEAKLSSFSLPGNSADSSLHQPSLNAGQEGCLSNSSGNQAVYPVLCQSGLPCDGSLSSNPRLGCADFQELRMMLLSEANLPLNQTDKTPSSAEVPGHSLVKVKCGENLVGTNKGNVLAENLALAPEPRPKSAVRVRLEDRFNSIQTENPRCQEPQESGVALNNLVTLIRQPRELIGVPVHQQENKCAALGQNKAAPAPPSFQFTYPLFTMNACPTGSADPPQVQASGTSCTILEAARHQDLGISKTLSFCYQETESTKQTVGAMNKVLPEEVWIKVGEDTLCKQEMNRSSCSRISPLDPNADRKPLGEIQNLRVDSQSTASAQGPWQSAQSGLAAQGQSGAQDGIAQRRERHNRLERDRRRRIRVCCDELNLLVPFCTVDTDKATTLQWTTAFLKYIQEQHGDSLKQEFETVFCGKTGRRLKIARSDSFVTCPVQENTPGYGEQVA